MSISTTGFVLTEQKDVFGIMSAIEDVLIKLVKKYAKDVIFRDDTSKLPQIECRPSGQSFSVYFKVKDEHRVLSVNFNCDCDYSEYGDSKVIWSVSCWGLADEIVLSVCEAMKPFGRVFYEQNDAVSDECVEV